MRVCVCVCVLMFICCFLAQVVYYFNYLFALSLCHSENYAILNKEANVECGELQKSFKTGSI